VGEDGSNLLDGQAAQRRSHRDIDINNGDDRIVFCFRELDEAVNFFFFAKC
jgi:hypothetical protein